VQPSPARNAQAVADASAQAITYYSQQFGPYPYSTLNLSQIPGDVSQGWPSLIFLSTYSFLTNEERAQLHMNRVERIASNLIVAHETAHQWWGDLVIWSGYRDQWIVEALSNYSALMLLETQSPSDSRALLDKYREDLLTKNKDGNYLMEAGAAALGARLSSSHFPNGYLAISYGRGTWLFHMLHGMLLDAEKKSGHASDKEKEDPFVRALRRLRQRYEGKAVTTRDLLHVFEEDLPPALWYEGKKSLDWFYEGWINGTAIPQFDLQKVKYSSGSGPVTVSGVIRQKYAEQGTTTQDLVTPVPVYAVQGAKLTFLRQVFVEGEETPFRLTAPSGTHKVVLDPHQTLLARVH
jgi:aminopeptidase N